MNLKQIAVLTATVGLAAAAFAGEEMKTKMAIAIVDDDSDGVTRIELDGADLDFDLHDMQEGENRSVVDKSGRAILITREADGYSFNVDGKTIKMPNFDGHHEVSVMASGLHDVDMDVHVMHHGDMATAHSMEGVTIISEKPVDDATQQAIQSLLESAGHGSDVDFIDTDNGSDGAHGVRIIKKKVEITK